MSDSSTKIPSEAAPIASSSILQSAIDRQEQDLADLQTELDRLADDFATRAAAIDRKSTRLNSSHVD